MDDKLKAIFANVHEMVKFSEAKNALLIALNGSAILGVLKILSDAKICSILIKYYIYGFIFFAILGLLISLLSFFPRIKLPWLLCEGNPSSDDNLILYTDICKYNERIYLEALAKSMGEPLKNHSQFEMFYANQIIVNSKIALRKYKLFRKALGCTISAILTPIIAILVLCYLEE